MEPLSIANALAGLPMMGWRQSYDRCSAMPYDSQSHLWYRVFKTIEEIWRQQPGSTAVSAEFFKSKLKKLRNKHGYVRDYFWRNWRDLRLAIEECGKLNYSASEMPFVISHLFIGLVSSQKTFAEQLLADKEQITG
jgi:hypothetical protein